MYSTCPLHAAGGTSYVTDPRVWGPGLQQGLAYFMIPACQGRQLWHEIHEDMGRMASSSCPTLWCCSSGGRPLWHRLAPPGSNMYLHLTLGLPGCALGHQPVRCLVDRWTTRRKTFDGNCKAGGLPTPARWAACCQATPSPPRTHLRRAGRPAADAQGCCHTPTAALLVRWWASAAARVPLPAVSRLQTAKQCDRSAGCCVRG